MQEKPIDPVPVGRGRRARGRPSGASVPHSSISAWIPTDQHDRLVALAFKRRTSVSRVVGELLSRRLDPLAWP